MIKNKYNVILSWKKLVGWVSINSYLFKAKWITTDSCHRPVVYWILF